jgi:predicted permease
VIWIWSPISLVSFWQLPLEPAVLAMMALQPAIMLLGWAGAAWTGRALGLPRQQVGVLVICAALSNQGFTLGAYLVYCLFEPAMLAMSYAIAFVTAMQVFMVIIFYPVAKHYGPGDVDQPMARLVLSSFVDVRAMPLYMAVVGLMLNVLGPAIPAWVNESPLLNVGFFIGAAGSYIGIGLRLRLADTLRHVPHHVVLGVVKLGLMPAGTLAMVWALGRTPLALPPLMADVVIISSVCPTAIASVIISNLFHLDARLASVLWLVNTAAFCVLPLPLILMWF